MNAEFAAGYCGEPSVDAFLDRVGKEYPAPDVNEGRRRLWIRDNLDRAMGVGDQEVGVRDLAEELF